MIQGSRLDENYEIAYDPALEGTSVDHTRTIEIMHISEVKAIEKRIFDRVRSLNYELAYFDVGRRIRGRMGGCAEIF